MKQCLIVESRDPTDHRDVDWMAQLALDMHRQGMPTSLFLTDNAVLGARAGVAPGLKALVDNHIAVSADRAALRERGIAEDAMVPGLVASDIDIVVDALLAGSAILWR